MPGVRRRGQQTQSPLPEVKMKVACLVNDSGRSVKRKCYIVKLLDTYYLNLTPIGSGIVCEGRLSLYTPFLVSVLSQRANIPFSYYLFPGLKYSSDRAGRISVADGFAKLELFEHGWIGPLRPHF